MEGIGIALDLNGERKFVTDLGGSIYSAKLDEHGERARMMNPNRYYVLPHAFIFKVTGEKSRIQRGI
jgi:hypothetical protein